MITQESAYHILNYCRPLLAATMERLAALYPDPRELVQRASLDSDPPWLIQLMQEAAPYILAHATAIGQPRD